MTKKSEIEQLKWAILTLTSWLASIGTFGIQDIKEMQKILYPKKKKKK